MAYNVQSLITILEQILNLEETRWILDQRKKPQLQSLLEKAASLQQILEKSSLPSTESQIQDAIHEAEDIIETHMVDQMLSRRESSSFTISPPPLHQAMQQLDSAMEHLVKHEQGHKMSTIGSLSGATFSHATSSKSSDILVGINDDLMRLMDRLTGMPSKLEIIPIVGMGGIGKTTITRKLYQHPFIVSHFDLRAWSTISQDYSMRSILSSLLGCKTGDVVDEQSGLDKLYKTLYCRRYLIVLDDIWSTQSWDELRRYFPDNNNGSRVVITSRESDVARYADSRSAQHRLCLLSKPQSWDLLHQIVFGEKDCSDALQVIGKKIVSGCGGLPLAISVIGGLLSKLERSEDVWEKIADDVRGAIVDSDQQFSNILSLSYDHLPNHLKPCFLYMGAFPEDYEIKASKLIHLWVAEGFVKSNGDHISLEEEAEDYLKALVERNLVLVREKKFNGKPKTNNMHDLLRDLCMRKADQEKFLRVKNSSEVTLSNLRRVSVHTHHTSENALCMYDSPELIPFARSFLSTGLIWHGRESLAPLFFSLRLLRVLDVIQMIFPTFPLEIFQLVNLRYLAFFSESSMPVGISSLCNLQSLIATLGFGNVPCDIWGMSELRHLKLNRMIDIDDDGDYMHRIVQKKLQTISLVRLTSSLISNGFLERIPNIKTLDIFYIGDDLPPCGAVDLSHLHQLETLRWSYANHLRPLRFPSNLRKLTLSSCVVYSILLESLCALPYLEVIKIESCAFGREDERDEEEWEAREEDEFKSLRYLHLSRLNLVRWIADEMNFPRLRHLIIRECPKLEEIPSNIGEIPTLELFKLDGCRDSVVNSARQMVKEQQSEFDNYSIQLLVNGKEELIMEANVPFDVWELPELRHLEWIGSSYTKKFAHKKLQKTDSMMICGELESLDVVGSLLESSPTDARTSAEDHAPNIS